MGPPASLASTPRSADDVIVAQVDGRPVWGSCVAVQASVAGTRDAALRQCIDFELMAQAAERRGLATDRDVVLATRTALVDRVVAREYEDTFTRPEDFGELWTRSVAKNKLLFDHAEYRRSSYVRFTLDDKHPSAAAEAEAKSTMERVAAALAGETGMMPSHFLAIAQRAAGNHVLDHQDVPPTLPAGLDPSYADALYRLPDIGRASPAVRTRWGWDIVLWSDVVPARHGTADEIVREALPAVKQEHFPAWVAELAHRLGVTIQPFPDNVRLLETEVR